PPALAEPELSAVAVTGEPAAPVSGSLAGHRVLDLFAGSGALGIEALSRGAAHCTFVERDRPALHALRANLAAVGVDVLRRRAETASPPPAPASGSTEEAGPPGGPSPGAPGEVVARAGEPLAPAGEPAAARRGPTARIAAVDARRALVADAHGGEMYTLVLVDPPYARYGELEGDLARLLAPLLAPGALVVLETHRGQALRLPWRVERVKRYADTQVAFMAADEE
ncbi:MAG: RsmD family RNA methyltransferase, partial [Thermoleophilia bacterium]|nr:RsmD family RNA methyltransferase [Thermoleophilia bacterium]